DKINSAIATDGPAAARSKRLNGIEDQISEKGFSNFTGEETKERLLPSLWDLAHELGVKPNFEQQLGLHPDFAHLKHSDRIEKHYIVSMFVDIKGSTNLFRRYTPETVSAITSTIQQAAIHTFLIFGGYIHRLQGDGLLVYCGRKGQSEKAAVNRAMQGASVFSYFVKYDLQKLFDQQGIKKIYIRTGIDLGYDRDVVWGMAGIGKISEVTTCSLHTSLASHMQSSAMSNGIVIGDNVRDNAEVYHEFLSPVCKRTENEDDRYIFRIPDKQFNYTQYDFDWLPFLKKQDFIATDLNGILRLKRKVTNTAPRILENIKPIAERSTPYLRF
ncbi:MAG: adenylate/guanylate cyclase domain-containing protein, partial [Tunicatimonas sp.]